MKKAIVNGTLGLFLTGIGSSCDTSTLGTSAKKSESRRVADPNADAEGGEPSTKEEAHGAAKSSKTKKSTDQDPGEDQAPVTPQPPTNDETKADAKNAAAATDFSGWCAKAQQVKPVTSGRLRSLLSEFCDGTTPKTLLTEGLIASAYVGTGDPKLTAIRPLSSNATARTTSYRFGVAFKLPLSLKDHFEKAGPKMGDAAEIKRLQESTGATATVTVSAPILADGPFHTQGWSVKSTAVKQVLIQSITSEATTRSDLFRFVDGQQYMYTQYTDQSLPTKTVKNFDYLGAGVTVGNHSYIIAVVDVVMDNMGFSSVAEAEIRSLAINGMKQIYTQAAQVK